MPSFEEHCDATQAILGSRFEEVHRWLDELQPILGPLMHREVRHNPYGVMHCIEKWGYDGGAAACLHIQMDLFSHIKAGLLWLPKPQSKERET